MPYRSDVNREYKIVLDVIYQKAEKVGNEEVIEPWETIFQQLQELYKPMKIIKSDQYTLPSLSLLFLVNSFTEFHVCRRAFIKVWMSQILPYYTVYVEEDFSYKPDLSKLFIKYNRTDLSDLESEVIDSIRELVRYYYPDYSFLSFEDLQLHIFGGIPIGADIETGMTSYPLFDFIFGKS